ncbi:MAG: hypothetical protein HKO75_11950 [Flavobacteriaceae bacterium]|nr:nitrous oxide reductase accessory protein NosL [Muriicola sp.]MBT8290695.1 nitrous oxide reductase accessory protein NosL [Muriicola sp.]NNK35894.1 hypothetical protein [Eudoraea sp.]NNL40565.1 hypothetical protein [Flavobacteriaceae bacterium]
MNLRFYFIVLSLVLLFSCKPGPEPIQYGFDGCHYCSMTIVDKQHASEFVTKKGKVYKFDASECMINFIRDIDRATVALYLVNDYNNPGVLVDAKEATYLISENIPSPMGAYLTAFNSREEAELARESNKGILLTWEELNQKFED